MIDCTENLCLLAALAVLATLYVTRARAAPPSECSARVASATPASARATTTFAPTEGPPSLWGLSEDAAKQFTDNGAPTIPRGKPMTEASRRQQVLGSTVSVETMHTKTLGATPLRLGVAAEATKRPPVTGGCQMMMSESYAEAVERGGLADGF